jgi:7-keto-8-aminopelargonate synthetase-like enzyme
MLMIDEAHSVGVLGRRGAGIGEHFGVERREVEIWMGTLSKALAACGGYIAGDAHMIEHLKYSAPGFVYSVGLSPAEAGAALSALQVMLREPARAAQVRARAQLFLDLAREAGLDTGSSAGSALVPVVVGDSLRCLRLAQALFERGINVQPILPPAVPEAAARLRFFITTDHTEAQIRGTVDAVREAMSRTAADAASPVFAAKARG